MALSQSRSRILVFSIVVLIGSLQVTRADVKMPAIFGDHMVLQQDSTIPIWGWASPGEHVTVTFAGQTGTVIAGTDGTWRINFPVAPPNTTGQTLTVAGETNTLTFQDVLVGDVWVVTGQSNMEFGVQADRASPVLLPKADDPQLRLFNVPCSTSLDPKTDLPPSPDGSLEGKWQICSPTVMAANWGTNGFSAVGYYFGREIRQANSQPLGLIAACKGGSSVQAWVSVSGLKKEPALRVYADDYDKVAADYPSAISDYPQRQADYSAAFKQWSTDYGKAFKEAKAQWRLDVQKANSEGKPLPPDPTIQFANPPPTEPRPPDGGLVTAGNLFNGMISPLIPYGIKGVICYQGESACTSQEEGELYGTLFPRLIKDWREKWGQGDFPFLYVQLANYGIPAQTPSEGFWSWTREAQLKALSLPNTGMASAIDLGSADNIHPPNKLPVGQRLATVARHVAYRDPLVPWASGPTYDSMKVDGGKVRITFKNIGGGLTISNPIVAASPSSSSPDLTGFGIAGGDHKFFWAKAVIEGDTVVVSCDKVPFPSSVRYNWADNPIGNLYSTEGLPASPFRTDTWKN